MFRRLISLAWLLAMVCLLPVPGRAQSSDPQAIAILTQSLNAVGGSEALGSVRDFAATGSITYYWAGEPVHGSATVRARGFNQFRLDANLPEGTRSFVVSRGVGAMKGTDGSITQLPYHNTVNLSILTFPYLNILAAVNDPLTTVTYVGLVDLNGRQAYQVRVQRHFSSDLDANGTVTSLCITDYFVDPAGGLLLKSLDMTHPAQTLADNLAHEMEFENYQPLKGMNVPTLIREKIIGQTIWELRLSAIAFNAGLTDLDFVL